MHILRPASQVPVRNRCDVLVVGAGPAGVGAAIAAARAGASVTIVEEGGKLGGMWTLGLVSPLFDTLNKGGLNAEIRSKLAERGAFGGLWDIAFDPVEMELLLDELVLGAGVDALLYTRAVAPIVENGAVIGAFLENKSGSSAVLADWVIDCTGDADLAAAAGVPYDMGAPDTGAPQPMTLMFRVAGVRTDYPRDATNAWYQELAARLGREQLLAGIPFDRPAIVRLPGDAGDAILQWTHVYNVVGSDAEQRSQATFEARKQVRAARAFLREARDILGDVRITSLPSVIGVRESRRIHGEATVTDDDVRLGRHHPDDICEVTFNVDVHNTADSGQTCIRHSGFGIPFGALVPVGVRGLLVAGRPISGSFLAHAAYRVTGNCLAMGEAAGRAAAQECPYGSSHQRR